jgi:hypothetical protein
MLCGIGADAMETALEETGVRQMIMRDKPSKDFVYVDRAAFYKQAILTIG